MKRLKAEHFFTEGITPSQDSKNPRREIVADGSASAESSGGRQPGLDCRLELQGVWSDRPRP